MYQFEVVDLKTGKKPDMENIALTEGWAKHLIYCDMDGFYIGDDGTLILADYCRNLAYCPADRFKVTFV